MAKRPRLVVNITEGVVVRPGDTVLLAVRDSVAVRDLAAVRQSWEQQLPGVNVVALADVDAVIVRRAD